MEVLGHAHVHDPVSGQIEVLEAVDELEDSHVDTTDRVTSEVDGGEAWCVEEWLGCQVLEEIILQINVF